MSDERELRSPYRVPETPQPAPLADIVAIGEMARARAENEMESRPCLEECGRTVEYPRFFWRDLKRHGHERQRCPACCERVAAAAREKERLRPIPGAFHWARFGCPELAARTPAAALEQARASVRLPRVVLVGPAGTGKTSLGCAMIRDRLDAREDVAVGLAWRLSGARSRHPLGEKEAPDVERAVTCGLLLLDDMGSERNIPSNAVPDVVFERHAEGRPTWVTTWMSPEKMAERYGDGIARRVFEGAVVIDCGKERGT